MSKKVIVVDDSRTARQAGFARARRRGVRRRGGGRRVRRPRQDREPPRRGARHLRREHAKLDGLEMLWTLRTKEPSVTMPVVMLTTEAQPHLLVKAKQWGARGWIVKPFRAEMLVARGAKAHGGRDGHGHDDARRGNRDMMNGKILIVDDSRMIRRLLAHTLARAGFEIIEAADGIEALDRLDEFRDLRPHRLRHEHAADGRASSSCGWPRGRGRPSPS